MEKAVNRFFNRFGLNVDWSEGGIYEDDPFWCEKLADENAVKALASLLTLCAPWLATHGHLMVYGTDPRIVYTLIIDFGGQCVVRTEQLVDTMVDFPLPDTATGLGMVF